MKEKNKLLAMTTDGGPVLTIMLNLKPGLSNLESNRLLFKELESRGKEKTLAAYGKSAWEALATNLATISRDAQFWQKNEPGLLVSVTANTFASVSFPYELIPQVTVGDIPFILPLVEDEQNLFRYHVLCLSSEGMKLFAVNQRQVEEVKLADDAPTSLEEALDLDEKVSRLAFTGQGSSRVSFHGLGAKSEEAEKNLLAYFRLVDDYVLTHYSKVAESPMILFTLPTNAHLFFSLSRNPFLQKETSIPHSPKDLSVQALRKQILAVEANWRQGETRQLKERFETNYQAGKTTYYLDDLKVAAQEGRIELLWLATEVAYQGDSSDLFNQLVFQVLAGRGKVYLSEQKTLPNQSQHVALLRY